MRREERVTVQGPVKEQQPDGMSHRGGKISQVRVGNFTFQIGRETSHVKSRGFCEIYRTPGDQGTDKVHGLPFVGYMSYSVQCSCPHQLSPNIQS